MSTTAGRRSAIGRHIVGGSETYTGSRYTGFSPAISVIEPHVKLPVYNTLQLHLGLDNGHYNAELYGNNLGNTKGINDYGNRAAPIKPAWCRSFNRGPSASSWATNSSGDVTADGHAVRGCALLVLLGAGCVNFDAARAEDAAPGAVDIKWSVRIPLRDGVGLNATVYRPKEQRAPAPCIFTLTPYIGDSYHDRAMYFAAHGLPFLLVDVRGRGNSEGAFTPFAQEINDGYDVVEWLAKQPYCNGKVSMWGGSYAGFDQWATAKNRPPHLATIVPAAAAFPGVDFPARNNISYQYLMQWLTFTAGHALQSNLFADDRVLAGPVARALHAPGSPFRISSTRLGGEQTALREWLRHPSVDEYLDQMTPTAEQFKALDIPILTITGSYDDDQPGALEYYRDFMRVASPAQRDKQFLIIGPWDHPATRTPRTPIGGIDFGPASLVDLPKLHLEWYRWTMAGGPKPEFLKDAVAYYVMGAEEWRYAGSLEKVTAEMKPLLLNSSGNPTHILSSGMLQAQDSKRPLGQPDHFIYDPRDVSTR